MTTRGWPAFAFVARAAVVALVAPSPPAPPRAQPLAAAVARGRAEFEASVGCSCRTDLDGGGEAMAGGRPIRTPFGVFRSTNVAPDPDTTVGRWSGADFLRAMREGRAPDGSDQFPVFSHASFTGMSDEDALALKAHHTRSGRCERRTARRRLRRRSRGGSRRGPGSGCTSRRAISRRTPRARPSGTPARTWWRPSRTAASAARRARAPARSTPRAGWRARS